MWLSRKSSVNSPPKPRSPSSKPNFNRHSFKNIGDLLGDDDKNINDFSDFNTDQQQPPHKHKQKHQSLNSPTSAATRRHTSVFHRVRLANQFTRSFSPTKSKHVNEKSQSESQSHIAPTQKPDTSQSGIRIPGAEKRIVVYLTSLRVVRPTFEACRTVRSILTGFRVIVDERDLSMDSSFKDELQKIMGQGGDKLVDLPKVFIGGRYIGDAEDLRQLNETGELKKMVEGLPAVSRGVCEGCSDYRFIICNDCNGSRKSYKEKRGGFRSCTSCNKNGLVKCPTCWADKS